MKTNGKRRIFALLMCVMLMVSAMTAWAGTASKVIGGTTSERATITLNAYPSGARAYTIPVTNSALDCSTRVTSRTSLTDHVKFVARGTNYAEVTFIQGEYTSDHADSAHQAGNYYGELYCNV